MLDPSSSRCPFGCPNYRLRLFVGRWSESAFSRRSQFMADSYQREIPKARVNISLDLHTGGASKRVELPLKLLVMGDYSAGREQAAVAERKKIGIDKANFNAVLAELNPKIAVTAP